MKQITIALVAGLLLAGTVSAYPGIWGTRGLWRVQDARSEGDWQLTGAFRYLYHSTAFANADEPLRRGYLPSMTVYTNDVIGAFGLSPSKYCELYFWFGGIREYSSRHPESSAVASAWLVGYENWWDWHSRIPGVKVSYPVNKLATVGLMAGYGFGYDPTYWRWGKFGIISPDSVNRNWLYAKVLGTFTLGDRFEKAPTVMVNVGQMGKNATTLGAAAEYTFGDFDVFAELDAEIWKYDHVYWAGDRIRLTPGVKYTRLRPVTFDLAAAIGLNRATPAFELGVGVSIAATVYRPPTVGTITGKVIDVRNNRPLAATVSFPDRPALQALTTDSKEGTFNVANVEPGQVTVEASAPGFPSRYLTVKVVAGRTAEAYFRLSPIATTGMISGTVVDAKTGKPLKATIEREGTKVKALGTGSDGSFGIPNLAPGDYSLAASSPGYLTATASVKVEAGQTARTQIKLVKKGMEITMKVFFDVDKWDLKPESHAALAEAAKILTENPEIRVEIQGHTDSTESEVYNERLSEKRAQAVVDYLVQNLKIDPARLTPKGYGETKPAAPNETEEGRAANRRVEFVILK